jgi:hypothetical protein
MSDATDLGPALAGLAKVSTADAAAAPAYTMAARVLHWVTAILILSA